MLNIVRVWILISTLLVGAGWILSAFHALNRTGYGVVFALTAIAIIFRLKKTKWCPQKGPAQLRSKLLKRFKRPAPFLFLILALMSLAAGALYAPFNLDTDGYRVPRVLHWLGQGQWHWIHTDDRRLNIAGAGFEWLSAPLILFERTDRLIFLINFVSYLMLPGLIFSVFTRLQVLPRVAWWWAWLLSSGWCFALQAGSTVNDSFTSIYALAAVDLALRARENKCVADLWLSMFAAGLMTGVKQTGIPLAALWLIAAWPGVRLLLAKPAATIVVIAVSLLVSALPVTLFNLHHGLPWSGIPANSQIGGELHSPLWGIIGNLFCIPIQNLLPPFFPWSNGWNGMVQQFLQTQWGAHFADFERFGHLKPGVTEVNAGIGLGICILTLISIAGARLCGSKTSVPAGIASRGRFFRLLRMVPWLLLLIFMAKAGTYENARQLSPYYLFLFPALLTRPGHATLTRRNWWRWLGCLTMLGAAAMLIINPNRPLFPAKTSLSALQAGFPNSKFILQATAYVSQPSNEERADFFRKNLPADETVIAYATLGGADEPSLWMPFGHRRVERLLWDDSPEKLHLSGVHYVVIDDWFLGYAGKTIKQWMDENNGDLVGRTTAASNFGNPVESLYLVRLR
jgi:hypothetical protein